LNLERLREWLIQKGIPAEELDQFVESPIIRDIGGGLLLSLQNDDDIGQMLVMIMMQLDDIQSRLEALEGGK
jgi:hypothetical protein